MVTVGIPKGLFYYRYFPLWKVFFDEINVTILVSGNTDKKILDQGIKWCVDEACLPIKVYHGHVFEIKDKVDYLFIPRFTSISRNEYICPKFGGLPDMIRSSFDNLPEIIDTEVNLRKSRRNSFKPFLETGIRLGKNRTEIKKAYRNALAQYRNYREEVKQGYFPGDLLEGRKVMEKGKNTMKILLLGHVYNTCDSFMNLNIVRKLRALGCSVLTMDMFDTGLIRKNSAHLKKAMFWEYGTTAIGCTYHIIENLKDSIDGIVYITSFGCGIDSFVSYLSEKRVRASSNIPFMTIAIDEHTGEAGLDTRLEAFIDTINWRKNNEGYFSSSG